MNTAGFSVRPIGVWIGIIATALIAGICYRTDMRISPYASQGIAYTLAQWYFGCAVFAAPLLIIAVSRTIHRRGRVALDLALDDNLESVGALVDTLSDGDTQCDRKCREMLIKFLPRLTAENAYLLDEYRQAKLRYIVWSPASPIYSTYLARLLRNSAQNIALRIAIIEALSRVGDSEALTMFNEMLDWRAYTVNERRIQQVVRDCYAPLKARVAKQPACQYLLRPADLSDRRTLLRIGSGEFDMPPEDLLHVNEQ